MFDVFNVMSMAAQLIPLSCMFAFESKRARFLIGTALLLPGLVVVLYFLLAFGFAEIPFDRFVLNRITLGSVIFFGCSALVIRIFALRDDREQVLTERLAIAEEAAQTSQALLESERKYSEVQALARRRQQGFMEATHDIKQPLASLRTTIDTIGKSQSVEIRTQLQNAFDYLEQLADSYSADDPKAVAKDSAMAGEILPLNVLFPTLERMFRAEAEAKGLILEVYYEDASLKVDALTMMRIMGNLVANAVKHTNTGKVRLRAVTQSTSLRLEVFNTGEYIANNVLDQLFQSGEKSAGSDGRGLGLAIVKRVADDAGLAFEFESVEGEGNYARLTVKYHS
ncbi:MAG: HAMP domain-containing sensor histidine kinase [Pseudomonadota bacterium]